jgi:hypothetical protein
MEEVDPVEQPYEYECWPIQYGQPVWKGNEDGFGDRGDEHLRKKPLGMRTRSVFVWPGRATRIFFISPRL